MKIKKFIKPFLLFFIITSCNNEKVTKKTSTSESLFVEIPNTSTQIDFKNTVKQDFSFNYIEYPYVFTGGGVAIGDINNDGLQDIYFTSNQLSNKLYLNKGDFIFEDITDKAGVNDAEGWTTGTNMIDINNDGWMDIYVCKSASLQNENLRKNKLFVNQKNGTFKDEAKKWGLDHNGFSIQSYFFDYDKDGDLDMYLVNHRPDFQNANKIELLNDKEFFSETSDHLFRNDGDSSFTNVTLQSKIVNKEWGLSASIGDFNNDGWMDVYVANDYIGPDFLYINNKNGTFSNQINKRFNHISYNSMGSDYADINNDMLPDLLTLDMSADDHKRGKQNMASMNTKGFWMMVNSGYHNAYMSNVLQLNNGNGSFSDIGQLGGISKTDWSWAPLIADFDNDGYKDVFITNGIERELGNQDYKKKLQEMQSKKGAMTVNEMMQLMPSSKLANFSFKNNGDLTFENTSKIWGFDKKINSNGVAYADFDNDGDLDLVINNMEDYATVYKNNSNANFINIKLTGDNKNINAIGAKVKVYTNDKEQYQELYPSRGYQSSVSYVLNFGLGNEEKINRIEVIWSDNTVLAKENIKANQTLTFNKKDFKFDGEIKHDIVQNFNQINPNNLGLNYKHFENDFNDFSRQVLLPQKQSQQGPAFDIADVNNDGLEDIFLGGALNQEASLFIQLTNGTFEKSNNIIFQKDKQYEDNGAHFFDADNDGDLDLYVTSGGYELDENSLLLQDRLYINNGQGNFNKSNKLPKMISSTKVVKSFDFDNDGDLDLIVGGRVVPGKYPLAPKSYILQNNNGTFVNVTLEIAPEFSEIGLVNDFILSDFDGDNDKDLIVVGEWMPITVFKNNEGKFYKENISAFEKTEGWWNTIVEIDFDNDGDLDYFVGNLGSNNKFHPSIEKPLHIYGNNFDSDGNYDMILSKVYNGNLVPVRGKECSTEQNLFVSEKIQTYQEFANSTLADIYGVDVLESSYHNQVYGFESVYIENKGKGNYELKELPTLSQIGPTMSFVFDDINKDGHIDVLGIGALHEAEVETVRYDSNVGYVLLGNSKGDMKPFKDISFYNNNNAKIIKKINIDGDTYFIIANNNASLSIFKKK
ncbi:Repeat domain-containing protein [Flaviramulus basaltis]|uniref:Repeat domain-containing protein n=1 Tax=Flaviramulus basaltis TaxID=369401 RepID=A0A1K2II00_9FLAO|nr:VCBS repeat-containing protein [Flaviramulus basaltis]SFZ92049.1 Repeat domain-containing protein [Flaviramulus basaltis]